MPPDLEHRQFVIGILTSVHPFDIEQQAPVVKNHSLKVGSVESTDCQVVQGFGSRLMIGANRNFDDRQRLREHRPDLRVPTTAAQMRDCPMRIHQRRAAHFCTASAWLANPSLRQMCATNPVGPISPDSPRGFNPWVVAQTHRPSLLTPALIGVAPVPPDRHSNPGGPVAADARRRCPDSRAAASGPAFVEQLLRWPLHPRSTRQARDPGYRSMISSSTGWSARKINVNQC